MVSPLLSDKNPSLQRWPSSKAPKHIEFPVIARLLELHAQMGELIRGKNQKNRRSTGILPMNWGSSALIFHYSAVRRTGSCCAATAPGEIPPGQRTTTGQNTVPAFRSRHSFTENCHRRCHQPADTLAIMAQPIITAARMQGYFSGNCPDTSGWCKAPPHHKKQRQLVVVHTLPESSTSVDERR